VGGFVTWRVEKSRQKHLEATRQQRDDQVAFGLARALWNDFRADERHLETEHEAQQWYRLARTPGFPSGEQQVLFRHLTEDEEFENVANALAAIEVISTQRGESGGKISEVSVGTIAKALSHVRIGQRSLNRLARIREDETDAARCWRPNSTSTRKPGSCGRATTRRAASRARKQSR
jgi:hypothetical protein